MNVSKADYDNKIAELTTKCEEYKHRLEQSDRRVLRIGNNVYARVVLACGEAHQVDMAVEEMAELTKALLKYRRAMGEIATQDVRTLLDNISEEMADVEIMLEQLKLIYCNRSDVDMAKTAKLLRLTRRLDNANV